MTNPLLCPSRLLCAAALCYWMVQPIPKVYAVEDLCQLDPACSAWDNRGKQFVLNKDYARAIEAYQKALAIKPEPRLIVNVGRCHHWLGQYEEALRAYQQYAQQVSSPPPEMRTTLEKYIREAEVGQRAQTAVKSDDSSRTQGASTTTSRPTPVYKKWWLWTILGVVAAGAIAGGVAIGIANRPADFSKTMPTVPDGQTHP